MPRAPIIDFENTSVELTLPRSVELRDELLVHGIPFDVYTLSAPAAPEGDGDEAAPPEPERTLLGTVVTHWGSLLSGEVELTQVSSASVQPAAPKPAKGSKKSKAKPPPPFTLSITASIAVLS